jgi:hypothetical protein
LRQPALFTQRAYALPHAVSNLVMFTQILHETRLTARGQ